MVEEKYLLLLALGLLFVSILLLRSGWRGKQWRQRCRVLAGWISLVAGTVLWSAAEGAEFGITLSLALWSLLACLMVAAGAKWRVPNARVRSKTDGVVASTGPSGLGQKVLTFIVAGPLAMVCSGLVSIVLVRFLPLSDGDQWVIAAFVFPFLWSVVAFWACASLLIRREALIILSAGLASSACLFLSFFNIVPV